MNDFHRSTANARIAVKLHRRVCLVQTEDAVLAEECLRAQEARRRVIVGRLTEAACCSCGPAASRRWLQELQKMGHTPRKSPRK